MRTRDHRARRAYLLGLTCLLAISQASAFAGERPCPRADDPGRHWYRWRMWGPGTDIEKDPPAGRGYLMVSATFRMSKFAPVAIRHEGRLRTGGMELRLNGWGECHGHPYLLPARFTYESWQTPVGAEQGEPDKVKLLFGWQEENGEVSVETGGKFTDIPVPKPTVLSFNLFLIAGARPFDTDDVLRFAVIEAPEINLKKNHTLTYAGPETIAVKGEQVACHRFVHDGEGIVPCVFWVDGRHRLVRVLMDGRKEFVLATEEQALAEFENKPK